MTQAHLLHMPESIHPLHAPACLSCHVAGNVHDGLPVGEAVSMNIRVRHLCVPGKAPSEYQLT